MAASLVPMNAMARDGGPALTAANRWSGKLSFKHFCKALMASADPVRRSAMILFRLEGQACQPARRLEGKVGFVRPRRP